MKLDLLQTVAFAGLMLFVGYGLKRLIPVLTRYNIPAPVVGGLPVAALLAIAFSQNWQPLVFDTTLQTPLQNTFFASIGYGASVILLRRGGPLVVVMMVLASITAALQNVLGAGVATALGQHPLMGVLAGSVTLTGGPATGLAFAPLFEEAGVVGASTLAVSAAMLGIVSGGLIGGPIGTYLLDRRVRHVATPVVPGTLANLAEPRFEEPAAATPAGEDTEAYALTKHLVLMLLAVGIGVWVSAGIASLGVTLPAYIGAMVVASALRNLDDATGWLGIDERAMEFVGGLALNIFLVVALMDLKLWQLAGQALALTVILAAQVVVIAIFALTVSYRLMGRDYDSAVMASGFIGFALGTTANAVTNMRALVVKYGPAPRAFLVVPLVGAFFIDFTNALIITAFVNWLR